MGTPVHDQRDFRVTIRFTESERTQLLHQMAENGYLSMSRYLRGRCLDGNSSASREASWKSTDMRSQVNMLSTEIARIGANYNLTVKEFKKLIGQSKRDGSPVIDGKTATFYLQQLNTKTLEVKALMEHIIGLYQENRNTKRD